MHQLLLTFALLASSVAAAVCNGYSALCDRLYSNITFVGSHDSAFVGALSTENQLTSVQDQLQKSVRFLQAQTRSLNGNIELCHTSCIEEDAGSLSSYLTTIKTFLDGNPNEVVTLLLTNQDGIDGSKYAAAFAGAGLDKYGYSPGKVLGWADWPTLGQLISQGSRLVVFMDFPAGTSVSYILDEFNAYVFETPYDTTDASFPQCSIDRPAGASATGRMYLLNHYLDYSVLGIDIPDELDAATTNSVASITLHTNVCFGLYGRQPNFVLLDYISLGQAMLAQAKLNGLPE